MKVTRAQAQANRAKIVETASRLFRERGYDGVGIADLMAAAGFTHGGFYKHFGSKAELQAEAAACGFSDKEAQAGDDLVALLTAYVSREHRDDPGDGCTLAALAGDAARQPEALKGAFAEGIEGLLAILSRGLGARGGAGPDEDRARSIDLLARAVGAVMLSRACPDDSPLANEVLERCQAALIEALVPSDEAPTATRRP